MYIMCYSLKIAWWFMVNNYLLKTVFKKDSSIASKYWKIYKVFKNYSETRSYSSYSSCFSNRISFRKA